VKLSGPDAVLGIVPKHLVHVERPHDQDTYGRVTVVEDMQERMQMMRERSLRARSKAAAS